MTPVYLRLESRGTKAYMSLTISIKASQWSSSFNKVRESHKRSGELNTIITDAVDAARKVWLSAQIKGQSPTAKEIKASLGLQSSDFFSHADRYLNRKAEKKNLHTYRNKRSALDSFSKFVIERKGDRILPFEEMLPDLILDYDDYLVVDNNSDSTRIVKIGIIKSLVKSAKNMGLLDTNLDPFSAYKKPSKKDTRNVILNGDELRKFEDVDLSEYPEASLARDAFMFSFYCYGMRCSDVLRLKRSNVEGDAIRFTILKTNDFKSIPLREESKVIIERYLEPGNEDEYIFPLLRRKPKQGRKDEAARRTYANQQINKGLRQAVQMAGIKKHITFHCARHSFAAKAVTAGASLWNLQQALGHKHPTTTAAYTKQWEPGSEDEEMKRVYENGR